MPSLGDRRPVKPLAHENRHDVQNRIIEEHQQQGGTAEPDAEVSIWDDAKTNYTTKKPGRYHYNALEVDAREAATELERGYLRRDLRRWGRERDL